jgi:hypothetical protein
MILPGKNENPLREKEYSRREKRLALHEKAFPQHGK